MNGIFSNTKVVVPIIVGAAAFSTGVVAGYLIAKRSDNEQDVVTELSEMTLFEYMENPDDLEYPEDLVITQEADVTVNNVFQTYSEQWDWEIETMHREDNKIYVIHYDEFVSNESNYTQETLTYYSGDDILTDQFNTPIYDHVKMTGSIQFGHGSGDPNVVFIRNDDLHMEWEILKDESKYQVEILGYEIEQEYEADDLKHSNYFKFREE